MKYAVSLAIPALLAGCTFPTAPSEAVEKFQVIHAGEVSRPYENVAEDIRKSLVWCNNGASSFIGALPTAWVHERTADKLVMIVGHRGGTTLFVHEITKSPSGASFRVRWDGAYMNPPGNAVQQAINWANGLYIENCWESILPPGEYQRRIDANKRII